MSALRAETVGAACGETATSPPTALGEAGLLPQLWRQRSIKSVTFSDPFLFRGTTSDRVLRQFGCVVGRPDRTSRFFEESAPVDRVETFVSHNWSSFGFVLYFNAVPSVVLGLVASSVCFSLTLSGHLHTFEVLEVIDRGPQSYIKRAPWCLLSYTRAFLLTLLFASEVASLVGFKVSTCFLDKYCVHQTDSDLKRQGVESLAAFLYYSWDTVVLYSDLHLQRLWTVFDFASLFMLHKGERICILPLLFSKCLLMFIVVETMTRLGCFLRALTASQDAVATLSVQVSLFACIDLLMGLGIMT